MEKLSGPLGWLKGLVELKSANKLMDAALTQAKTFKPILPETKNLLNKQYLDALKRTSAAKETIQRESAGFFGLKPAVEKMTQKLYEPAVGPLRKEVEQLKQKVDNFIPESAAKPIKSRTQKLKNPKPVSSKIPPQKKWDLKSLAIGGGAGFLGANLFLGSSQPEDPVYNAPYKLAAYEDHKTEKVDKLFKKLTD